MITMSIHICQFYHNYLIGYRLRNAARAIKAPETYYYNSEKSNEVNGRRTICKPHNVQWKQTHNLG